MLTALLLASCTVTDGDTIRCGDERVRLSGIDAPEVGKCREGRQCAPGDPTASTKSLRQAMAGRSIELRRLGTDRYDRTIAVVYAGGVNLACVQLASGNAIYVARWDDDGIVARECGL